MRRLIDIAIPTHPDNVPAHLESLAKRADSLAERVRQLTPQTDRTVALANFCAFGARELRHVAQFYPHDVAGLAWAARNLFESSLIVRYVLSSDDALRSWLGQALNDEKEFIEGVLAQSNPEELPHASNALNTRLKTLQTLAAKYGLEYSKPFRMQRLAEKLGEENEYDSLFKLFSKYVHPSSVYLNKWAHAVPDEAWLDVFLVKSQLYAGYIIRAVSESCGLEDVAGVPN